MSTSINNNLGKNILKSKVNTFHKYLTSPVLIGALMLLAIASAYLSVNTNAFIPFAITAGLIAMMLVYTCLTNPLVGYYLTTVMGFFAFWPTRILNKELPIPTFVELVVLFLFLGTYLKGKGDVNFRGHLMRSGVTIMLIVTSLFFIVELFNPAMGTPAGWLFTSKRYTVYILFFVISYRLINTPERFRYFLKFWIVMSFIAALYACTEQWFGFLPFELAYIKNDPHEYALLFQGGVIRKFSFLDGIVTFSNLAGSMAVITTILALNEKNRKLKYRLAFAVVILIMGMSYAGARTTTIMMPAGIALYVLITLKNKTTLITLFTTMLAVLFIMFAPIDNPTINRMRSTFDSKDESLVVRDINRKYIQPYIYAHPIGGGIATSGVEGQRFNPLHTLAGFPPDSGLLKLAIETGCIGLALTLALYLTIVYQGIVYYFKMQNEEYKKYIVAITCGLFSIIVTLYAQVSIGQIPNAFFFYAVMALFKRLMEFDDKERLVAPA